MDFLTPLGPGDRLGPYSIVRTLGEGGMGVVFEARDLAAGRSVALKVLSSWLATELGRARFEREVHACAQLTHPNVVRILDCGETDEGTLWYAMEYLDGWDLKQLVELDGAQTPARTIRILYQIAGALADAHENGLIHRDIKPPNILLCGADGVPDTAKLVDFGLVSPILGAGEHRVTLEGNVIGTPRYVAPEMLRPTVVLTPATDFYALGLVAYYLLSGRHALDGASAAEILAKQQHDEPTPLCALVPSLPADLASVVHWCLDKDPARRPQSGRALQDALQECEDADRWDRDAAAEWWDAWRERPLDDTGPGVAPLSFAARLRRDASDHPAEN
ncbi:MAG: serine/threonine protein kinase [Sandaracinaceae bacterium]|nr:serine/threonine protein kinase [Sandaracinaceae bacterium]